MNGRITSEPAAKDAGSVLLIRLRMIPTRRMNKYSPAPLHDGADAVGAFLVVFRKAAIFRCFEQIAHFLRQMMDGITAAAEMVLTDQPEDGDGCADDHKEKQRKI